MRDLSIARPLPVSSPPPPPPVNVAKTPDPPRRPEKPDQYDANIEVYERVFLKCLDAAERIVDVRFSREGEELRRLRLELATTLFDRFFSDQGSLQAAERQANAVTACMQRMFESRR